MLFVGIGAFEKLLVYKGTQKSASQKPQLELLTDAEICHNLHSLCLGENDRIRLSKALVLRACDRVDFFVKFSPLFSLLTFQFLINNAEP